MNLRNVRRGEGDGCLFIMVLVIFITVLGMSEKKEHKSRSLPNGAINVIELGNGWRQFTLDGERFMVNDDGVVSRVSN